jgi:hypothetical protein
MKEVPTMLIQLNTDRNITGDEPLKARVDAIMEQVLGRFSNQITRLEIHLSDQNSQKGGDDDLGCVIEARLEGRQPIAVSAREATLDGAISSAARKLKNALETELGRARPY